MDIANAKLRLLTCTDDLLDFKEWLGQRRSRLGADIETEGLQLDRHRIRLVQFGDMAQGWSLPYDDWKGVIKEVCTGYDRPFVFHNSLFDTRFLKRDGISIPEHLVEDSMVMAHLVDSSGSMGLKPLAAKHVHPAAQAGKDALKDTIANVARESKIVQDWEWEIAAQDAKRTGIKWDWSTFPVDHPAYWLYGALDCCLTVALAEVLWPKVVEIGSQRVYEVEMGAIHVLRDAELRGVLCDPKYLREKRDEMAAKEAELQAHFPGVRLGSDAEVLGYLQSEGAGALLTKRTAGGRTALDEDVLSALAETGRFPIAKIVHDYRFARKLRTSYFDKMLDLKSADNVVHPSIKPLGARTGRQSITAPALQTIPRGRIVRDSFVARPGNKIVSADFAQVEYRVLAHAANEESMIRAFLDGVDMHNFTAQMAYDLGERVPTADQRQIAKAGSFAKLYGAGIEKFAATLGISQEAAADFFSRYERAFPGIASFMQNVINVVNERAHAAHSPMGYVVTPLGRKIMVERYEAYKGVNYLIQSTATADTLKVKLCEFARAGISKYLLLPIHDETLWEIPEDEVEDVRQVIAEVMPDLTSFRVPLTVEVSPGVDRWGDAK